MNFMTDSDDPNKLNAHFLPSFISFVLLALFICSLPNAYRLTESTDIKHIQMHPVGAWLAHYHSNGWTFLLMGRFSLNFTIPHTVKVKVSKL